MDRCVGYIGTNDQFALQIDVGVVLIAIKSLLFLLGPSSIQMLVA